MDVPRSNGTLPPLVVDVTREPGELRIRVAGEVDLSNVGVLSAALSGIDVGSADTVRLDLEGLTFCDVAGVRLLLQFRRDLRGSGHRVDVRGASDLVRKVCKLLG